MNFKWNEQQPLINFERTGKTYWQNLTAPLSEGEKILRYWCCFSFCFIITSVLIYQFQYDVMYELQFQFYLFSKKYYWLTSNSFCFIISLMLLFGILIKRWWYWFVNNFWLTAILFAKSKMKAVDVYWEAQFNGIIMTREYFNHNWNFYLYKALTPEQVEFALRKEFATRYNSISFLTYRDCRYGYYKDPWVEHFFQNFRLDYYDVKSYERIRSQIEIFQENKLREGQMLMDLRDLEFIRDHPVQHYGFKYYDAISDFFSEYTGHIILGSIVGVVLFSVIYYNFVETNFKENCIYMWNRWVEFGFNPNINPRGRLIEEQTIAPVIDVFGSKMISIFGSNNPENYLENLQVLMTYNAELLRHFSTSMFIPGNVLRDLTPELMQKAVDTLLPQTVSSMVPQMLETQELSLELLIQILS